MAETWPKHIDSHMPPTCALLKKGTPRVAHMELMRFIET